MKICMVVPDRLVKGGIASVVNGYREHDFSGKCEVSYIESYRNGSKWEKLAKALKGYLLFFREMILNKPDIVHIHSSFGPSFYRKMPFIYMACFRGVPVINHIHGAEFETFYLKASDRKKRRIRKVYGKCTMLIALSEEWKRNLESVVSPEKITVIENYCKIPDLSGTEKKKQILFLGEIGKRKGCYDIPEIYGRVLEKGERLPLIMAGDGELAEVKKLFEDRDLQKDISFPGWVRGADKDKCLKESGIFLFPSYYEGMPMAVLEAMAYGMAIVTTRVGGIPHLLEDGVNGYLCEPGDIEGLSKRLLELSKDGDKRRKMGERARQKAIEEYSMESHIKKLMDLYDRVKG
ncbi:MAG: glycosyltransferase family 4 protein [Lachnospiraceae bacterium]|jgi:glycosyltransferase involved in cell wall biosynthesis|nr:glycosyltransferase family 4 protein [Lachnospiraceae bacterium]